MSATSPVQPLAAAGRPAGRRPVAAAVQGTLALDLGQGPPSSAPVAAHDRGTQGATGTEGATVVPIDRRAREHAEAWARAVVQAAVEVVGGLRPGSQLVRWATPAVYADVRRRAQLASQAASREPLHQRTLPPRPQVLSVHGSFPARGVLEAAVHVRQGRRSRAVAARFELRTDRDDWVCTALDFS